MGSKIPCLPTTHTSMGAQTPTLPPSSSCFPSFVFYASLSPASPPSLIGTHLHHPLRVSACAPFPPALTSPRRSTLIGKHGKAMSAWFSSGEGVACPDSLLWVAISGVRRGSQELPQCLFLATQRTDDYIPCKQRPPASGCVDAS